MSIVGRILFARSSIGVHAVDSLDWSGYSDWLNVKRLSFDTCDVQSGHSAAKLAIKRAILDSDYLVGPDSVERQNVYNDQRWCFVLVDGKKVI